MVAVVHSATLFGVDAHPVEVEAELSMGLPGFSVIGLGDTAIQEARYRVQAALRSTEIQMPHKRITVNLAPAALRKDGASLDLPMTLSLLVAAGILKNAWLEKAVAVGELALSGQLRPVRGILPIASQARARGFLRLIVPFENGAEASAVRGLEVLAPRTLGALIAHLRGEGALDTPPPGALPLSPSAVDFRDVKGQRVARRAMEIAAVGAHNILLVGPPGSGKTMLAKRVPTILPALGQGEQIEVTQIWSAAGLTIGGQGLLRDRPFRSPHHSISPAGLIGGGSTVRPGEISLAHRGVLFLDEMPELPRRVLESLRQPMEDRQVIVARARHNVRLPSAFMLVGAANPCPCGWLGHPSGRCTCTGDLVEKYVSRISGPILDRIDMVIEAPSLSTDELLGQQEGEDSRTVRTRVVRARARTEHRNGKLNTELSGRALRAATQTTRVAQGLLRTSLEKLQLSARGLERTLRIARSIADLAERPRVNEEDIAEALRYRVPKTWRRSSISGH